MKFIFLMIILAFILSSIFYITKYITNNSAKNINKPKTYQEAQEELIKKYGKYYKYIINKKVETQKQETKTKKQENKPNFTIQEMEEPDTQDKRAEEEQRIFFIKRAKRQKQEKKELLEIYEKPKQQPKRTIEYKLKKGREYEYQIFKFFKNKEYKVYPKGYYESVKDEGIDLIAYKEKEILLVQCKNWKTPPKQNDIKIFAFNCDEYIKKNLHKFKDKTIRKIFVTSCQKQDYGVKYFLKDYNEKENIKIEYIIIPNLK